MQARRPMSKGMVIFHHTFFLALMAVVFSLCASIGVWGQGVTATLRGRVLDASGATIPSARVTLTNTATNQQRIYTTGADGLYVFALLPRGDYSLTVEATGFRKETRPGIVLEVGQDSSVNVTMQLGSTSQSVVVAAGAPLLQTENASVGNVVSQQDLRKLPLNLLNYQTLALMQPNVFLPSQNSTLGFRGGFNVAGQSEVSNLFTLDGVDNMDVTNQPNVTPVLDAVQEFRVLTGTYSAEYGRQAGGQVIVVTKSGGNSFHGSAYFFYRNAAMDAENFFATSRPSYSRKQFGGTFGGPLLKNKLFFFGSYGGIRAGEQVADIASVPTVGMHTGDFSVLAPNGCGGAGQPACLRNPFTGGVFAGDQIPKQYWSSQGAGLLGYFPLPSPTAGLGSNLPQQATSSAPLDQGSGRIDYNYSTKTSMYVSYNFAANINDFPLQNPLCTNSLILGYSCLEHQHSQLLSVSMTHIFNPHVIWEGHFGFGRFAFSRIQNDSTVNVVNALGIQGLPDAGYQPDNNGLPRVVVSGFSPIGGGTNLPQERHDNNYDYTGDLTVVKGAHTIKTGFDIRRMLTNQFLVSQGRGQFSFNGKYTGNSVADLLLGLPAIANRNPGDPGRHTRDLSTDMYVEDNWKAKGDLSINFGLRYEINRPSNERTNKMASFDPATNTLIMAGGLQALPVVNQTALAQYPAVAGFFLETQPYQPNLTRLFDTQWHNFGPRFGVAWSPFNSTKWVIRAGVGIFFDYQIQGNGLSGLSTGLPFHLNEQFINTKTFDPSTTFTLANAFGGNPNGALTPYGIAQNFKTATVDQWSLGFERTLASNTVIDVYYQGSKGTHLPIILNLGQAITPGGPRPFAGWGNVNFANSIGNSSYNGLNVRFQKRYSNGVSFLLSYAYSKSLDEGSGISTGDANSNKTPQNSYDLRGNRGPSDFDITHRFVYSAIYALPFGRGKRFLTNASGFSQKFLGNWQVSGILSLQTGPPFTVLLGSGFDNSETFGHLDYPNVVGDPFQPGKIAANPGCTGPSVIHDPSHWFNPCAFVVPAKGNFGNEGRNSLRSPGLKNLDFSLLKNIEIREHGVIQLQAEFFNIFNHPNFGTPVSSIGSFNSAGVITDPSLGKIQVAGGSDVNASGSQREIQLGVHYIF